MQELTIEAGRTERHYWRDLWLYRELFYFLAWRDLLIRYKQTYVGVAWAVIRPLLTVIVMSLVFGKFAHLPSGGLPYPLVVFCGILPWQFFASALSESGNSLVSNSNLISKVYFPRLIVPASSVITSFVDFLITAVFLCVFMGWYRIAPWANIMFLPLFVAMAFAASLGVGLWVAALMVEYRDFRIIVPFVVQFGFFITPAGYIFQPAYEKWHLLYSLNPMVGVIEGFRWCILGGKHSFWPGADIAFYWPGFLVSLAGITIMLITGIWYFRKTERTFADVI